MSTVVIGGGVIGLCVALELSRRSRDVIVLDASTQDDGASSLNCGWLTMAHSRPLPNPGNLRRSIGWLARRNGPLTIRAHADPAMLRWLLGFAWSSRPGAADRGLRAMATLSADALEAYDDLAQGGVDIEYDTMGTIVAFTTAEGLEEEATALRAAADLGLTEVSVVPGDEARAIEPSLSEDVVGVLRFGSGRVTRPELLMAALRKSLSRAGVEVRRDTRVVGFELDGRRVSSVRTTDGCIAADDVMIAAGVGSPALAARLGTRIPVQAGRGYAIDLPTPRGAPAHLVELGEASMIVVPFDDGLRLCGTMEIARPDDPPDPRRTHLMLSSVGRYFAGLELPPDPTVRVASRPMAPDDLPIIGPLSGVANATIATGHGMLGLTLAAVTARLVADQLEGRTSIDPRPFAPDRFRWQ